MAYIGTEKSAANVKPRPTPIDKPMSVDYISGMTKLLDDALDVVRRLPASEQDDIARAILRLTGHDDVGPVPLTTDERQAIARSKGAAARGDFATDEQVAEVWAKHGS
jgi:hypothetical protein